MGDNFIKAKIGLEYGQFCDWCTSEAGYNIRKVQLRTKFGDFRGQRTRRAPYPCVCRIPARSAIGAQAIIEQVLALARDGERVKVTWVENFSR